MLIVKAIVELVRQAIWYRSYSRAKSPYLDKLYFLQRMDQLICPFSDFFFAGMHIGSRFPTQIKARHCC